MKKCIISLFACFITVASHGVQDELTVEQSHLTNEVTVRYRGSSAASGDSLGSASREDLQIDIIERAVQDLAKVFKSFYVNEGCDDFGLCKTCFALLDTVQCTLDKLTVDECGSMVHLATDLKKMCSQSEQHVCKCEYRCDMDDLQDARQTLHQLSGAVSTYAHLCPHV